MSEENPLERHPGGTGIGSALGALGVVCGIVALVCAFTPWWASNAPFGFVPAALAGALELVRARRAKTDPTVAVIALVLATLATALYAYWHTRHFAQ